MFISSVYALYSPLFHLMTSKMAASLFVPKRHLRNNEIQYFVLNYNSTQCLFFGSKFPSTNIHKPCFRALLRDFIHLENGFTECF